MKKMRILLSLFALIAFKANATIDAVDFTPTIVCVGSQTNFTSISSVSGGVTITNWNWDLDADGQFDDAFGPSINHQFNTAATYNVGLQIITDAAEVAAAYKLITVNPVPSASFIGADVCYGSAHSLVDQSTIASGNIASWNWDLDNDGLYDDASGSSVSFSFGQPSSYVVGLQVTSSQGCQATTSQNVTVDPMPSIGFTVAEVCLGDLTELTSTSAVSSGVITNYQWELNGNGFFDDATGASISNQFISDGNYQIGLQVTSDQGCVKDTFQLVTIAPFPYVNFSFDNACQNTPVAFTNLTGNVVGTISYEWSFGASGSSTDVAPSYSFTSAGPNTVQLIGLTSFGCADTLIQTIEVHPTPEADFSFTEVCEGIQTNFTNLTDPKGATIESYFWDYGDGNFGIGADPIHPFGDAGVYNVMLIAYTTDGCRDTVFHSVNVWNLPEPVISHDGELFFCEGENVTLTVNPVGTPTLWSTGEITQSITVDTTGQYNVLITDEHGCKGEAYIEVYTWLLPNLTLSNDTSVSLGELVPLWVEGASTYVWTPGSYLDDPTLSNPTSLPKENITYTVTGTDNNGCVNTADVSIEVLIDYNLKPVNLFTPNNDDRNERFYVGNIECYSDCKVTVFNRWGVEVFSAKPYLNDWKGEFNDDPLPDGTYYYVIECDGKDGRFDGAVTILK
jgi:gliding motility-associated-like protein